MFYFLGIVVMLALAAYAFDSGSTSPALFFLFAAAMGFYKMTTKSKKDDDD